ncbi:hypothetical protein OC835_002238 [Tilletia horrida]|nr:hypothetical protein OC835_002238 [Tilletia horrida]
MSFQRPLTPPPSSSVPSSPAACRTRSTRDALPWVPEPPGSSPPRVHRTVTDEMRPSKRRKASATSHSEAATAHSSATSSHSYSGRRSGNGASSPGPASSSSGSGGSTRLTVKGNVTPSRAAPFFQLRPSQSSRSSQPRTSSPHTSLASSQEEPTFASRPRLGDSYTEHLQTLLRRPPPAASSAFTAGNLSLSLLALRTSSNPVYLGAPLPGSHIPSSRGLHGRPTRSINTRPYLSTFSSRQDLDWYELESSLIASEPNTSENSIDEHLAHPLCCAYSYSAKAAEPSSQWLAIGDNEARIVLLNTLDDTTADEFSGAPQWRVSGSASASAGSSSPSSPMVSVFELAWRHDDVLLASSAPDYTVAIWDVSTQMCTELFSGPKGTARSIQWDPEGAGNLLSCGGRDGAIHLFDRRVRPHERAADSGSGLSSSFEDDMPSPVQPVLSIWGAHTSAASKATAASTTANGTQNSRTFARGRSSRVSVQRGVTALSYLPGRPHCVVSSGCEDGRLRVWDWRAMGASTSAAQSTVAAAEMHLDDDVASDIGALGDRGARRISTRTRRQVLEESDAMNRSHALQAAAEQGMDGSFHDDIAPGMKRKIRQGGQSSSRQAKATSRKPAARSKATMSSPVEESCDVSRQSSRNQSSHGIASLAVGNNTIFAACTDANIYALNASCLVAGLPATSSIMRQAALPTKALYNSMQRGNTLFAKLALDPQEQILAVGCNSGKVVLYDVKCRAGFDASAGLDLEASTGVVLEGGHLPNSEINGVSWAHGPQGTTLATIADDFTVRTWRPDRAYSQRLAGEGVAPLELDSEEEFEWETRARKVWRGGELDDWDEEGEDRMELDSDEDDCGSPLKGYRASLGSRFAFDSD